MDFEAFKRTIVDTLDKYAPLKKKYLRANHSNFVTKELSKYVMNRSRLRNQFLKNRSVESGMKYNKQRHICVALLRKTKDIIELDWIPKELIPRTFLLFQPCRSGKFQKGKYLKNFLKF